MKKVLLMICLILGVWSCQDEKMSEHLNLTINSTDECRIHAHIVTGGTATDYSHVVSGYASIDYPVGDSVFITINQWVADTCNYVLTSQPSNIILVNHSRMGNIYIEHY